MLFYRGDVAESDLSSAAEQVCSLVQALLLYHNRPCPDLVSTQGKQLPLHAPIVLRLDACPAKPHFYCSILLQLVVVQGHSA